MRKPNSELLEYMQQVSLRADVESAYHQREKIYAARLQQLAESPDRVMIPLQVLQLGDLGICAIPFEVFTETGLEIKQRSPSRDTFTIELANGSYGYLPTPEQHQLGGYETWMGTNRVEEQASVKIVERLMSLFDTP